MSAYLVVENIPTITHDYQDCDYCDNKVDANCLEPDEKNLAEQGGGYACAACADLIYEEEDDEEDDCFNNVINCVNIGDVVYDKPGILLGKCFYKSNDGSNTICLENKRLAIWIKGKCLKQKHGWLFIEGNMTAFYKDCCL